MLAIATRVDVSEGFVVDLARVMSLPAGLTYPDIWRYSKDLVADDVMEAVAENGELPGREVLICAALPIQTGGFALAPLRRGTIERVEVEDICTVAFRVGDFIRLPRHGELRTVCESSNNQLFISIDDGALEELSFTASFSEQKTEWARTVAALQCEPRTNGVFDRTLFCFAWVFDKHGKEPSKGIADKRLGLGEVTGYQLTAGSKYELLWMHRVPGFAFTAGSLPEMRFKLDAVSGLTSGSGSALVRGSYQNHSDWALYPTKTVGKLEFLEFGPEGNAPDNSRVPETKIPVTVRFAGLHVARRMWPRYLLLAIALWVGIMWSIFSSTSIATALSFGDIIAKLCAHWSFAVVAFFAAVFGVVAFVIQKGYGSE